MCVLHRMLRVCASLQPALHVHGPLHDGAPPMLNEAAFSLTYHEKTRFGPLKSQNFPRAAQPWWAGQRHTKGYTACRSINVTLFLLSTATF